MTYRVGTHSPINIWETHDGEDDVQVAMAITPHKAAELVRLANLGAAYEWLTQLAQDQPDAPLREALHAWHLAQSPELAASIADIERQLADGTFEPGRPADEVMTELRERYGPSITDRPLRRDAPAEDGGA